ncbi:MULTISPECIES: DUF262 domain-containing protein [unclassified Mucilaginibacter]|uniref:DUF262 domain-containing protein n=1 Tax=unclassified Mucilaginibacter TaxID=2617802 RepID=UPI000965C360|nr:MULTISPECIES: DUF262 domain-containing protein [unclassified Mucilaginibacter]OJW12594.1 MAG: hypothetical protein BGO48_05775 [Mucilaginibacter sp. 44-25]
MTKYQVRSKELIDVINEIKDKRLIMSPYFQRNLVWRLIHKVDFIKTIILGYPFPQIFIARGSIDLDNMSTTSCIVDGQQRMNSINEFIKDGFKVDNTYFSEFSPKDKEAFLKYQIPIIDLDIDNEDPEIIEIFKRLNRTFYSLSGIEKLSTEYAASEFMLVAKLLSKEIKINDNEEDDDYLPLQVNPTIPKSFFDWAIKKTPKSLFKLFVDEGIFSPYELTRQVHLTFTLNIISTYIADFYNRNDFISRFLEEYSESFDRKDEVFDVIEAAASKYSKIKFKRKSYWYNKANAFSLMCFFTKNWEKVEKLDEKLIKSKLEDFEDNLPNEYAIAAKEGVNNKQERLIRNRFITNILL